MSLFVVHWLHAFLPLETVTMRLFAAAVMATLLLIGTQPAHAKTFIGDGRGFQVGTSNASWANQGGSQVLTLNLSESNNDLIRPSHICGLDVQVGGSGGSYFPSQIEFDMNGNALELFMPVSIADKDNPKVTINNQSIYFDVQTKGSGWRHVQIDARGLSDFNDKSIVVSRKYEFTGTVALILRRPGTDMVKNFKIDGRKVDLNLRVVKDDVLDPAQQRRFIGILNALYFGVRSF